MTRRAAAAPAHFFPIRHHSPACAAALLRALGELKPAQVLIEGPADFELLIDGLVDPLTLPPVAVVSLPPAGEDGEGAVTYPFAAQSPEYVALVWARANGAQARFIDLPSLHPDMRRRLPGGQAPTPLIETWRLDHNAYVDELCARRGVSNGGDLWDALFESQGPNLDWRGFFASVEAYCGHIRAVAAPADLASSGDLAREAHMATRLAEALAGPGPVAVVTGGFHTPALRNAAGKPVVSASAAAPTGDAYLIRYGFRQLDRGSGYAAGLPHAGWYDRLWKTLAAGEDPAGLPLALYTEFSDALRRRRPPLAFPTPTVLAAALTAARLAELRDLPFPGRAEVIDALRSTAVKDAVEIGRTPLLEAFHEFLVGDALGDLPRGAVQPPIVDHVRRRALSLRFDLTGGERRSRDLDVLRKPRHREASGFLHALDLLDAGFAGRTSGPDMISGWREGVLFETWAYAWSPMVESRLIARAADGQTLEALCAAEFDRRRAALAADGLARSSAAFAGMLVVAEQTCLPALTARALEWCLEALTEDPDIASVVRALSLAGGLAARRDSALAEGFDRLRRQAFERLLLLFPGLAKADPNALRPLVEALAELAALASGDDETIDREDLGRAVEQALADGPPPALDGALAAFGGAIGLFSEAEVAERIRAGFAGTYLDPGGRAAALTGCLSVNPRLIAHSPDLRHTADAFLAEIDAETFLKVLPELRLALSQLTPTEVDAVAGWVASRHGLADLDLAGGSVPPDEVAANLLLSERLEADWRADGLDACVEARP